MIENSEVYMTRCIYTYAVFIEDFCNKHCTRCFCDDLVAILSLLEVFSHIHHKLRHLGDTDESWLSVPKYLLRLIDWKTTEAKCWADRICQSLSEEKNDLRNMVMKLEEHRQQLTDYVHLFLAWPYTRNMAKL